VTDTPTVTPSSLDLLHRFPHEMCGRSEIQGLLEGWVLSNLASCGLLEGFLSAPARC